MRFIPAFLLFFLFFTGIAEAGTITVSDYDIQAALNKASDGDTIIIQEGTYTIETPLVSSGKDLTIEGQGEVTLNINTGSARGIQLSGSQVTTQSLSSSVKQGDTKLLLDDASEIEAGDLLRIFNSEKWCPTDYPDQKTGELYKVESVRGNTVTLNEGLLRDYSTSDSQIEVFRPVEIHIKNIKIINQDKEGVREGMSLTYCIDSSVTDCEFRDNGQASLRINTCYNTEIKNNEIYNSVHKGNGYGVSVADSSAYITIENNYIKNCRHCIMSGTGDFKGLNRGITISGNELHGGDLTGAHVIDSHPMTIDYTVTKNKIYPQSAYIAIWDGTYESEISDNEIHGGYGAVARRGSVEGGTHVIKNNQIDNDGYLYGGMGEGTSDALIIEGNSLDSGNYHYAFNLNDEKFRNVVIKENLIKGVSGNGIFLSQDITEVNVEISGNEFADIGGTAVFVEGSSKDNVIVKGNSFESVGKRTSFSGISVSDDGSVDVDSGNSKNWKDLLNIITVEGCDGERDQEQINDALKNATEGSTVFLPSGEYWVDDSINFASAGVTLKGEEGTVIRVSKTDRQWFSGFNGIIISKFSDTTIENIEIDGNCDELDNSLANSRSDTRHDCERAIVVQGSSNDFLKNIIIKDVTIRNCFSDGVHIRFAENVYIVDCYISNTQHECIFFVCVKYGLVQNCVLEGVTSDCVRYDNCKDSIICYSILDSYEGNDNNGAPKFGHQGVQIGDQGYSYGGGTDWSSVITTSNIEVYGNTFTGKKRMNVWIDSAQKGVKNVYFHDNSFLDGEIVETEGTPVTGIPDIGDISRGPSGIDRNAQAPDIFRVLMHGFSFPMIETDLGASATVIFNNISFDPHSLIEVDGDDLKLIKFEYGRNTTRYFIEKGIWTGDIQHIGNELYIPGLLKASSLKITVYSEEGYQKVTDVKIIERKITGASSINPDLFIFIAVLAILGISIVRNLRRIYQ